MRKRREPIHVGVAYSLTGPYGLVGREMLNGLSLAIDEINAIEDIDFEFVPLVFDPGGDLQRYEEAIEGLICDKGVRHIVGCYTSASRKQVLPLLERYDRLLWHSARYEGFESSENVIYVGAAPNQHIVPLAAHMIRNIGADVFCVGSNYIWTWETTRVLQEIVTAASGHILGKRLVALGATDIDHIVQEILEKRPPAIFNTLVGDTSYLFYRQLRQAWRRAGVTDDVAPPILSCSLGEHELHLIGPSASIGHLTSSVYFGSIDTPTNRNFVRRYRKMFGSQTLPSADVEAAYLCGILLGRAVKQAGGDDVHLVRNALYRDTIDAPQGKVTVDPETNHCYLTPRLARSRRGFRFDVVEAAEEPVKPDPYLAWLDIDALVENCGRPDARGATWPRLRVVQ
jgi:branched-chain amino acid transport system substrate-binding protein